MSRAELALHFPRIFRLALRRLLTIRPSATPVEGEYPVAYCLALLGCELRVRGEATAVLSSLFDSCLRLGLPATAAGTAFGSAAATGGGGVNSLGGSSSWGGWFTTRSSISKLLRRWLGEAGACSKCSSSLRAVVYVWAF